MKRAQELLRGEGKNYILPFLWMKGEDNDTLRREIGKIAECGIREICLESRPHPDFAGPGWWDNLDAAIDEAQKRSMRLWILDDRKFPTGYANGGFDKHPELAKTYLAERHMDLVGPQKQAAVLISPFLGKSGKLLSVFAIKRKDGSSTDLISETLIDLTDSVSEGFVYLDIPEGRYRLIVIYTTQNGSGRPQYMNLLDRDSVRVLIDEVYEKHYARYAQAFGNTIAGFFSDEPEIGNMGSYDFHELPGKAGHMLPWSEELRSLLIKARGASYARELPALWFDCGSQTPRIRMEYMDMVTRLVQECFSDQVGSWCRAHSVEYIGHIIEDDNAHGRLGCSVGHYFREMRGQDMAGVDVVHFQIVPGFEDKVHQWLSWDSDGAFFHYGLAKLASSQAHIDPKTQGRSLCEIFGNYGWACGIGMMKWLTDHMLVRGINHFTPHAFSMKYPDPDCPPHFYAGGNNPQFPYFADLMRYMNRVCHLFNGGVHYADAAVLYHAQAEWSGEDVMTFDRPGRVLMENQLDYDVIPEDAFALKQTRLVTADGRCRLEINREQYPCVVQPYFKRIPDELAAALADVAAKGLPVFVTDELPDCTVSGAALPEDYARLARVVPLARLASSVSLECGRNFEVLSAQGEEAKAYPHLRSMLYRHPDGCVMMFFNEAVSEKADACIRFAEEVGHITEYDAFINRFDDAQTVQGMLKLDLFPGQARIFIAENANVSAAQAAAPVCKTTSECVLDTQWRLSLKEVGSEDFIETEVVLSPDELPSMNSPAFFQSFVGTYRYEGMLEMPDLAKKCRFFLRLDAIGDCGAVYVNGKQMGRLYGNHCSAEITGALRPGANTLAIEVTNTPVWKVKDPVSTQIQLHPTGMTAQPVLITYR